jgi:hypothetical protein
MKVVVGGLCLVVAVLIWQVWNLQQQLRHRPTVDSDVAHDSRTQLELSGRCAMQSEKTFQALGYRRDGVQPPGSNTGPEGVTLENHYNQRLNKCFMLIVQAGYTKKFYEQRFLLDAFEGRAYGDYFRNGSGQEAQVVCTLTPIGEPQRHCRSEEEFNAFVATYMQ